MIFRGQFTCIRLWCSLKAELCADMTTDLLISLINKCHWLLCTLERNVFGLEDQMVCWLQLLCLCVCVCKDGKCSELTAFVEVPWSSLFKTSVGTCPRGRQCTRTFACQIIQHACQDQGGKKLDVVVSLNSQLCKYESPEHHPQSDQAENKAMWIYSPHEYKVFILRILSVSL